ncbi:MAG: chemotaxis protein CheX [Candidatus Solibacter sp.]
MNVHKTMVESLIRSASEVFSTMLGSELASAEVTIEPEIAEPNDGVVSFIGIAGSWVGTGSLTCSPSVACRICSAMLMTEAPSVNEDVLDAVAELTNMIVGSVKTDLESELGPLGLSIPTVVFGRNFKTRNAGTVEWIHVRFLWDAEPLLIKMCLSPNEKPHLLHHGANPTCALEVSQV